MADSNRTGNPVFDLRAGFRATAGAVQRWLFWLGLILVGTSLFALAFGQVAELKAAHALCGLALGAALLLFGAIWGFAWRNKLRAEFRKEFGSQDDS